MTAYKVRLSGLTFSKCGSSASIRKKNPSVPSEIGLSYPRVVYFLMQIFLIEHCGGWRMVKSETRRDAEILVRNLSPSLVKSFETQKK